MKLRILICLSLMCCMACGQSVDSQIAKQRLVNKRRAAKVKAAKSPAVIRAKYQKEVDIKEADQKEIESFNKLSRITRLDNILKFAKLAIIDLKFVRGIYLEQEGYKINIKFQLDGRDIIWSGININEAKLCIQIFIRFNEE